MENMETKLEPKFKVGDILFYRGETCGYLKVEEIREENGEIRYYETSRNLYLVENDPNVFADKVSSVETEETKPIDLTVKGKETKERIEITIPEDYEYVIESSKIIFTKKKKEYPKTYEECCNILHIETNRIIEYDDCLGYRDITQYDINLLTQLRCFREILICRDAYWKLYGEEMGLSKPWKPDWNTNELKYIIYYENDKLWFNDEISRNTILVFPTAEMRDIFYENFITDIEFCKEFL